MSVSQANQACKGFAGRRKKEIRLYHHFPGQRSFYFLKNPWRFPGDLMFQKSNLQCLRKRHQLAEPKSPWCWENIPRAQSLCERATNPSHCRQSGCPGSRYVSKRLWSLLNWSVAVTPSLLLKIKLLFRYLHIYALSFRQLNLKIFGPNLLQWLLKSGNGAKKIISHARMCAHTHAHTHTYIKWTLHMSHYGERCARLVGTAGVLLSVLSLQMFSWAA